MKMKIYVDSLNWYLTKDNRERTVVQYRMERMDSLSFIGYAHGEGVIDGHVVVDVDAGPVDAEFSVTTFQGRQQLRLVGLPNALR